MAPMNEENLKINSLFEKRASALGPLKYFKRNEFLCVHIDYSVGGLHSITIENEMRNALQFQSFHALLINKTLKVQFKTITWQCNKMYAVVNRAFSCSLNHVPSP